MHELGLVNYAVKEVTKIAEANNVTKVKSVTLEFGEVSGIVNEQLTDCWNWFREKEDLFKGAELKIEVMPAVTFCESCKKEYETVKYGRTCPYCGSPETYLITGNQFEIKEIEAETRE